MALSIGGGGPDSMFELRNGQLYERPKVNIVSAYMLVYIRESDRQEIMKDILIEDIP